VDNKVVVKICLILLFERRHAVNPGNTWFTGKKITLDSLKTTIRNTIRLVYVFKIYKYKIKIKAKVQVHSKVKCNTLKIVLYQIMIKLA